MPEHPQGSRVRVYVAYAIVSAVWGSTYLAIRVGVKEMPPFWMASLRFTAAGLVLGSWALFRGVPLPRKPSAWGWMVLTGILILGVAVGGMFWAEQYIDSGLAALLAGMSPIFMALYGSIGREGDRLTPGLMMGLLIGLVGVAVLVDPSWSGDSARGMYLAVLVILLGAQAWSGGSVLAKRKLKGVSSLLSSAVHALTAGVFLFLVDLIVRGGPLPTASLQAWLALGYLAIFGSIIAYSAYVYLVNHMAPARAGTYSYINPVVAVFLGWLILDEPVTWRLVAGGLIILSGLFLVRRARLVVRTSPPPGPSGTG
ncbi:MAG: EamA family transporter [bacterium]